MPLATKKSPGLADLLNDTQSPFQQKKLTTYPNQNKLNTTLAPGQQSPLPSVQQPSVATTLPQKTTQNIQQPIGQTTLPPISETTANSPTFATTTTETTDQPVATTGIDWATTRVQGSDLSVADWFESNTFDIEKVRTQRQKAINDAATKLYNSIGSQVKKGMSLSEFTNLLATNPQQLRQILGDNANEASMFGLDPTGQARNLIYNLFDGINNNLQTALAGLPDVENIATNGGTPTIFRDEKGRAIAQGYIVNGKPYIVKDLRRIAEALDEAQNIDIPGLTEWMEENGYDFTDIMDTGAWEGMQDLIDRINNPEQQEEWVSGGLDQAGRILGLGDEEGYQDRVGGLADLLEGGIAGQEGLTAEERDLQERQMMSDIRSTREETKLIIESLGAGGRSAQALVAADEISSQIGNMQIQYRLKIAEQNYARQQAQYESELQQYQFMVQAGQMNVSDFIQKQRENAAMQLAIYGQEISMIESANAQYLQEYGADLAAMQAHAQAIYNGIMTEMGLDGELRQQVQDMFNSALAPYTQMLQNLALMREERAYNSQQRSQTLSAILGMIGAGAQIVAAVASGGASIPVTAAANAAAAPNGPAAAPTT